MKKLILGLMVAGFLAVISTPAYSGTSQAYQIYYQNSWDNNMIRIIWFWTSQPSYNYHSRGGDWGDRRDRRDGRIDHRQWPRDNDRDRDNNWYHGNPGDHNNPGNCVNCGNNDNHGNGNNGNNGNHGNGNNGRHIGSVRVK